MKVVVWPQLGLYRVLFTLPNTKIGAQKINCITIPIHNLSTHLAKSYL
jgi:hypothetical protein